MPGSHKNQRFEEILKVGAKKQCGPGIDVCREQRNVEGVESAGSEQTAKSLGVVADGGLEDAGHTDRRCCTQLNRPTRFCVATIYTNI